jgi:hypothetical protein
MNPTKRLTVLQPLNKIIKSWRSVLKDYVRRVPGDLPFCYGERAHVGFLAIAAWQAGFPILVEWPLDRGTKRKPSHGRNDLWIGLTGRKKPEFFIEAKHIWCELQKKRSNCSESLEKAFKLAQNSFGKSKFEQGSHKIAIVFVSLYLKGGKNANFTKAKKEWRNICKKQSLDGKEFFFKKAKGDESEMLVGSSLLLRLVE